MRPGVLVLRQAQDEDTGFGRRDTDERLFAIGRWIEQRIAQARGTLGPSP